MESKTYEVRDGSQVMIKLEYKRVVKVGGVPHTLLTERITDDQTGQEAVIVQQVLAQTGSTVQPCILYYCQKTI